MHALLEGGHEGEAAVTQEPKLSPRLSAAQLVTARPYSCSQSPLDSTQPAAEPPTDHRLRKLHPLSSGGFNGSAQQETSQRKLGNGVCGPFRSPSGELRGPRRKGKRSWWQCTLGNGVLKGCLPLRLRSWRRQRPIPQR